MLDFEELLQTEPEKDLPDMRLDGVESIYLVGTESGLIHIHMGSSMLQTDRKAATESKPSQASTNTTSKEAVAAGLEKGHLAGQGGMPGLRGLPHSRITHSCPYRL